MREYSKNIFRDLKFENTFTMYYQGGETGTSERTDNSTNLPNSVSHGYISVAQRIKKIF